MQPGTGRASASRDMLQGGAGDDEEAGGEQRTARRRSGGRRGRSAEADRGLLREDLGSQHSVLAGHPPGQSPLELGLQGQLAQALGLLLAGHVSLLLKSFVLQPVEAGDVVSELDDDRVGRGGCCVGASEGWRVGVGRGAQRFPLG